MKCANILESLMTHFVYKPRTLYFLSAIMFFEVNILFDINYHAIHWRFSQYTVHRQVSDLYRGLGMCLGATWYIV